MGIVRGVPIVGGVVYGAAWGGVKGRHGVLCKTFFLSLCQSGSLSFSISTWHDDVGTGGGLCGHGDKVQKMRD